jgi:L-lysine 6-oxidase
MKLSIHPSVGVARLGNSRGQFYLSPGTTGGLPYEADAFGNERGPIIRFKDDAGQVRRQGQPFKILDENGDEITLDSPNVATIQWTVHLASKKAAWYQYSEEEGNLLFGEENSYASREVPFRNPEILSEADRQKLIVDPGPRTISGRRQTVAFDAGSVPPGYPASFPPSEVKYGTPVKTLGNLVTDDLGRLIVLGGYGDAGGDLPLTSYGGSSTWHDDISDGPVYCVISFRDKTSRAYLQAWVIVGSPDFAPEIVNISTLSDTMFDVGVRNFNLVPDMYHDGDWDPGFQANYQRDILPIMKRMGQYQWVSNIQPMLAFTSNIFDFTDASEANRANRENYFSYFRAPNGIHDPSPHQPSAVLFKENGTDIFPMVPLNSGGQQMNYQRGINNFVQMVEYWFALAFIRNRNAADGGYPFFTETERNNELFSYKDVPVSDISGNPEDAETTIPVFYIETQPQAIASRGLLAKNMVDALEARAFKAVAVAAEGLGLPRSGTRNRR